LNLEYLLPPLGPEEEAKFQEEERHLDSDVDSHRKAVEAACGNPSAYVDENGIKPEADPVIFIDQLRMILHSSGYSTR